MHKMRSHIKSLFNVIKAENKDKKIIFMCLIIFFFIFKFSMNAINFYKSELDFLVVRDDKIVNFFGEEIFLRGLVLSQNDWSYGFSDREPYASQTAMEKWMPLSVLNLKQIKNWGCNTIIINVWWSGTRGPTEPFEDQPYVYNEEGLSTLLTLIRMAREAKLKIIIQVRVCYDPEYTKNDSHTIFGWTTHDYVVFNQKDKSGIKGLERFSNYLEWLSKNVCQETNVIGIEPWHYPYHRQKIDSEKVHKYFSDIVPAMIKAVRKHSEKIIFISPPHLGHFNYNEHPGPFNGTNIVYTTGGYGYHYIVSDPDSAKWDFDKSALNHPHKSWRTFRDKYNVPIMSTEGPGIAQHNFEKPLPKDRLELFDAVLTICDDMSGWIIHMYTASEDPWGVLENKEPLNPESEGPVIEIIKKHTS
jgi:hypothetical protein